MRKQFVTKEVKLIFGVSRMRYEIHLPPGLRCKPIEGESGVQQYFLDEFPVCLKPPYSSFPVDSFVRHDAMHYGIRLSADQVEEA